MAALDCNAMPKPTRSQIDAEIIDRAAGLFAKHGFAHTSLQQIADAVNYSKAGLLHHFPSKQAIYDAALQTCRDQAQALLEAVGHLPPGAARERVVVEASVDQTYEWPGVSALANRLADNGKGTDPALTEMALMVYKALGIDLQATTMERIVRVTSALSGLGASAMVAAHVGLQREWRTPIIEAAMDALGHGGKPQRPSRKRA